MLNIPIIILTKTIKYTQNIIKYVYNILEKRYLEYFK